MFGNFCKRLAAAVIGFVGGIATLYVLGPALLIGGGAVSLLTQSERPFKVAADIAWKMMTGGFELLDYGWNGPRARAEGQQEVQPAAERRERRLSRAEGQQEVELAPLRKPR